MKVLNLNFRLWVTLISVVTFAIMFSSCEKNRFNNDLEVNKKETSKFSKKTVDAFDKARIVLKRSGFNEVPILLSSELVAVNDVTFDLSNLVNHFDKLNSRNKNYINLVGERVWKLNKITVNILPGMPKEWKKAVRKGVSKWNSLNISLSFKITENNKKISNGINVKWCNFKKIFPNDYAIQKLSGLTDFPKDGNPGNLLRLNSSDKENIIRPNYSLVMHELGHALGFLHPEETYLINDPYLDISGGNPSNSIMYPKVKKGKDFCQGDIKFFEKIY